MRTCLGGLLFALANSTGAAPPATTAPAGTVACDVRINVIDPDPKGLNVRAAPQVAPGNIVGVLKHVGEWTTVHVIGNQGEWFLIDGAEMTDDDGTNKTFSGRGWVHRSKVGDLQIEPRDVLQAPRAGAKSLISGTDTARIGKLKVTACQGKFIQLQSGGIKGWASRYCTNELTTCV